MPFIETLTPDIATQCVANATQQWMARYQDFYRGNHLRNGEEWIGPGPQRGTDGYDQFYKLLQNGFIYRNIARTIVDNKANAYAGMEAQWSYTVRRPLKKDEVIKEDEQKLIDELQAAQTSWWDKRGIHRILKQYATGAEITGRRGLRFFIPAGLLIDNLIPVKKDVATAFDLIYLESPKPENLHVYSDSDTQQQIGIYLFAEQCNEVIEGKSVQTLKRRAEITYLNEKGETVLAIIGDDAGEIGKPWLIMQHLWHFETRGEPLLSNAICSLQNKINLAETTSSKNLVNNGWLEEFLINAQLPGAFKRDEQGNETKEFVPAPITRGPNQTRDLKGINLGTENEPNIATPSVTWRPIVDPKPNIEVAADAERSIHKEAAQLYTLDEGGGNVSGETLKQRRAVFETSLNDSTAYYEAAVRWVLETSAYIASHICQRANDFDGLRAVVEARIDTGPKTAEELGEISARVAATPMLLSPETAMAMQGVIDTDAEQQRIDAYKDKQKQTQMTELV